MDIHTALREWACAEPTIPQCNAPPSCLTGYADTTASTSWQYWRRAAYPLIRSNRA